MAVKQEDVVIAIRGVLTTLMATLTPTPVVYDSYTKQNPQLPLVKFTLIVDKPIYYFDSDDSRIDFQVDVFGRAEAGPAAVRAINDVIVNGLNRSQITITGLTGCQIINLDKGNSIDQDFILGGRTQQDRARIMSQFRIFGTGS